MSLADSFHLVATRFPNEVAGFVGFDICGYGLCTLRHLERYTETQTGHAWSRLIAYEWFNCPLEVVDDLVNDFLDDRPTSAAAHVQLSLLAQGYDHQFVPIRFHQVRVRVDDTTGQLAPVRAIIRPPTELPLAVLGSATSGHLEGVRVGEALKPGPTGLVLLRPLLGLPPPNWLLFNVGVPRHLVPRAISRPECSDCSASLAALAFARCTSNYISAFRQRMKCCVALTRKPVLSWVHNPVAIARFLLAYSHAPRSDRENGCFRRLCAIHLTRRMRFAPLHAPAWHTRPIIRIGEATKPGPWMHCLAFALCLTNVSLLGVIWGTQPRDATLEDRAKWRGLRLLVAL